MALDPQRAAQCETRVVKVIFPGEMNHHGTLFGGIAMQWMDEVSFIAATRYCRLPLVTVSSDRIDFKTPIPSGSLVELAAQVVHVGRTSIKVKVDIAVEDMYSARRKDALSGEFTFVAVDDQQRPTEIH